MFSRLLEQVTNKGSDQTARMRRLVWAFAGLTYHIVGNLMPWLKWFNIKVVRNYQLDALRMTLWHLCCMFYRIMYFIANLLQNMQLAFNLLLSSADFFFKINFVKTFFQKHYQSVKRLSVQQFRSRSGQILSLLIWVETLRKGYQ